MEQPLLSMEGITKQFPGVTALDDLSLELRAGEVHALLGENGAGKSTLIKVLYGVYRPDAGSIRIDGRRVHVEDAQHATRLGIGVVFQELNICTHLDVANNIFLGRPKNTLGVIDERWMRREAGRILADAIKLDIDPARLTRHLSIAEQQMVEIAKVVSRGCRIIVFDEPTSSLTENEIEHLFEIILDLKRQGVGIIYISHRLEELPRIADRVTVLRDGRRVGTMDYKDTSSDELIRLMVGREFTSKYPKYERKIGEIIFEVKNLRCRNKLDIGGLTVRAGEIVGLAGLVGAGRTESMRALFGVDPADEKEAVLFGKTMHFRTPGEAIDEGFVYMTENRKLFGLCFTLDVESNINLASLRQLSSAAVMNERRAADNAESFRSRLAIKTPSIRVKAKNLSGGNQQKVILAKWLSRKARVLVFDEPTRGIDVGAKYEIYKLMNELSDQGIGIIMISSELPEILGMSDRVVVYREGRIAATLDRTEADSELIMRYATGVKKR
ncbi:MAG: sugar ABC transporter ATP-binding protein [Planctomycetota bacterium]|jgi:ribose transport system ATP-binding protein|nr:sugar ABC transporter ATP-binding protein [Planctomycetota bacterium]